MVSLETRRIYLPLSCTPNGHFGMIYLAVLSMQKSLLHSTLWQRKKDKNNQLEQQSIWEVPQLFFRLPEVTSRCKSYHSSARPWQVNFVSGQVDFQLTCLHRQVVILAKLLTISYWCWILLQVNKSWVSWSVTVCVGKPICWIRVNEKNQRKI